MKQYPYFSPLGDRALRLTFGHEMSTAVTEEIQLAIEAIKKKELHGVTEMVPSYTSLTIYYDPAIISSYQSFINDLKKIVLEGVEKREKTEMKSFEIPVCYDGPDLQYVADHAKLSVEEVIEIHSTTTYSVQMIGFAPGFPYLGGLDERLEAPRRTTPRPRVEAGAVGIAGKQSGIYSHTLPGGWRIIGRTPLVLFDQQADPPSLLKAGDKVTFKVITSEQFANEEASKNEKD